MNKVLEVKNITKSFGNIDVLKGVSFSIDQGEIFGFLGRNGAGKSTLINILTGVSSNKWRFPNSWGLPR